MNTDTTRSKKSTPLRNIQTKSEANSGFERYKSASWLTECAREKEDQLRA